MGRVALLALVALSLAACTRVSVTKNPDDCTEGIRYYRPKPYLFITAGGGGGGDPTFTTTIQQHKELKIKQVGLESALPETAEHTENREQDGSAPKNAVSIELVYLPDFSEEYAIDLRPGLGIGELNVQLENGWNLTTIGIKTDQQVDEIIGSVAEVVGAVPEAGWKRKPPCIYATNIPFGFYEAVIARDPYGRKQLYGWRYVGFMPFQACPTDASGMEHVCCDSTTIYGLVWVDNMLQFRPIADIPRCANSEGRLGCEDCAPAVSEAEAGRTVVFPSR